MVATTLADTQGLYPTADNAAFDGATRISISGLVDYRLLLYDGRAVTAAMCVFANGITGVRLDFDTATTAHPGRGDYERASALRVSGLPLRGGLAGHRGRPPPSRQPYRQDADRPDNAGAPPRPSVQFRRRLPRGL